MKTIEIDSQTLQSIDTAFEMVRISWDSPTPQATNAINEAWAKVRELVASAKTPVTAVPALSSIPGSVITDEQRLNLLCCALEGGSNYWYWIGNKAMKLIDTHSPKDNTTPTVDRMWSVILKGLSIQINDAEEPINVLGEINLEKIQKGEALMLAKNPQHFAEIIAGNEDAETGDVWFQYCVLGDIVFG